MVQDQDGDTKNDGSSPGSTDDILPCSFWSMVASPAPELSLVSEVQSVADQAASLWVTGGRRYRYSKRTADGAGLDEGRDGHRSEKVRHAGQCAGLNRCGCV